MIPPINNRMYNEAPLAWWDENDPMYLLKAMVNPWRVPYFTDALIEGFGGDLRNIYILDIGCGGGVLAEEFARLGCHVKGIDVATASLTAAHAHTQSVGLQVDYQTASALRLPYPAGTFDVVTCCDVLEHILEWEDVICEASRVLKAGGLFFFDTINRTPKSKVTFISGLQHLSLTRLFPDNTHVWEMFITPSELEAGIQRHGLSVSDLRGGVIPRHPLATLWEVRRYKRGVITAAELGSRLALKLDSDLSLNYLGVARKKHP